MKKLYEYICIGEAFIARFFLITMVILIFGAGLARMAAYPINWAIDIATCLFAWACFFCADIAWRRNKLMSVEVLTNSLSERGRKFCRMLNYLILTGFLLYLIGAGLWLSYISRARSFQGIPEFSYSWVTMSVPVGASLLLITTVRKFKEDIKGATEGA
ncbi:MAG: TRAP transporter small permease subunit [Deltaproteobacteria bacterium]|nr:TRAP transporter small permease subunit [Deltaproteobacteria bacterium]